MPTFCNFHGYDDREVRPYQTNTSEQGWTTSTELKHITTLERDLRYQFHPHFHPYVAELIKKLLEKSIPELQSADTLYVQNADGTMPPLPGSMFAAVFEETTAKDPDDEDIILPAGTRFVLPDNTAVQLDGETNAPQMILPGDIPITSRGDAQEKIDDATHITVTKNSKVFLVDDTDIIRPNGQSAQLVSGTPIIFLGSKPKPKLYEEIFSETSYAPSSLVELPYPAKDLDFTSGGAYSVYNWELFFHVPITIAIHLSRNQRFAEAQSWFHFIFDPTDDGEGPTPDRFWKVRPFQYTDVDLIQRILVNLSDGADPVLWQDTFNSIQALKDAPFRPHVVARYRQTAYMFKTVMAYLDNLISWGDTLFRQDTGESINEATQLYVLAANILGPRPQEIPRKGSIRPQTYHNLRGDLDVMGNVLVELENDILFNLAPHPGEASNSNQFAMLRSIGEALYFCIPRNDKLLGYWDTVADRLFKIRNSLNIQGIFRQLPLFEPPIDPALLARAAAAGLDVGAILSGLNQPLPLVRFQFLVQKASEICQEVKSLGNNLLAALEKEDNEALAVLRARHERIILELAENVRYSQWQEAIKTREGLEKSLINTVQRLTYYERLLGREEGEIDIPELEELDSANLEKMKFRQDEPEVSTRPIEVDIAQDLDEAEGKVLSSHEAKELEYLGWAQFLQDNAVALEAIGAFLNLIPHSQVDAKPVGVGGGVGFGGMNLSQMLSGTAKVSSGIAGRLSYEANKSAKIGSYSRREQEWAFQSNLAAGEINQTFKQLRAAQIREAIAEREWKNHQQQIKHAEDIEHFLDGEKNSSGHKKTSTKSFYTWMKREVRGLYSQCFQFAFDVAKKAERALQHELGDPTLSYLHFGYLSGKEGLLAGEKLYLDIKRMEIAYHDLNRREYELTKHVSLLQVDPTALLQLRATGRCTVTLPEELFDMDGPGHYFRRIKTVGLSIPCVTGPYTNVNCTLTLLKSTIRGSSVLRDGEYIREDAEDDRFSDHFGSLQSIVTSSGQNDSGLFETNLRDERYLPFEGSGVISEWQLELPADPSQNEPQQFDYDTISDVILHIRYTAREGGELLRGSAIANLTNKIDAAQTAGSVRLFSVRHEFPSEWAKFKSIKIEGETNAAELMLEIRKEHFPYWSKGRLEAVNQVDLWVKNAKGSMETITPTPNSGVDIITHKPDGTETSSRVTNLTDIAVPTPPNQFILKFGLILDDNSMDDLWMALTWGKE